MLVLIWEKIIALYKKSLIARFVGAVWNCFKSGAIYHVLHNKNLLERNWTDSYFYKFLNFGFNLVPNSLARLDGKRSLISDSVLLKLASKTSPYYMGAYLCFILVVPYSYWDNMYSLILSAGGLFLYWLGASRSPEDRVNLREIGPWPVIFATACCFSLIWSQDFSISFRFLFFTLTCIFTVIALVSSVKNETQLLRIVELMAIGLLICSLYGVYQSYVGVEPSSSFTDLDTNANMPGRVFSFFKNPNAFANLLVYFIPISAAMIFYSPTWREKLFFLMVTGAGGIALLLTLSRGGWFALAVSFFVLALCLCPRWVPLFILLVVLALPLLPDMIKSRIMSIFVGDSSVSSRNYIYSAVVRLLEENWLLGVGLGTSALKRGIAYYDVYYATFPFVHAHNILLEIWAESGIVASVAFICTICASFVKGLAARKRAKTPLLKAVIAGAIAGLTGSMVFGLTDYAWTFPRIMVLFWFLFAILYTAIKLTRLTPSIQKEGLTK